MIVTIDGPAGTGKSTVAHLLAKRLELEFLDTGAMYRAVTLLVLERGLNASDGGRIAEVVRDADIRFDFNPDPPQLLVNGRRMRDEIRSAAVTAVVSIVAGHADVRHAMVQAQRAIALAHDRLVTEGRDQGSYVFPDADVKFYLDASSHIRAHRRLDQMKKQGEFEEFDAIRLAIEERDRNDRSRPFGALVEPHDAIHVDTGPLEVHEVVDRLERLTRERAASLLGVGDAGGGDFERGDLGVGGDSA